MARDVLPKKDVLDGTQRQRRDQFKGAEGKDPEVHGCPWLGSSEPAEQLDALLDGQGEFERYCRYSQPPPLEVQCCDLFPVHSREKHSGIGRSGREEAPV